VSLINKMLQDLDARQTSAAEASYLYTKPVARRDASPSHAVLIGSTAGLVALAVAGAFGWRHWQAARQVQNLPHPVKVLKLAPVAPPVVVAPPAVQPSAIAVAGPGRVNGSAVSARAPERKERREAWHAAGRKARASAAAAASAVEANPAAQGKDESPAQRAETAYRRALSSLQEGYINEAMGALDQALQANPRHDAARQTLVGLLIENKRFDEAMRQLQLGLALDPRQPAMAMLLARLQIERGGAGIETLNRTLPYAGANSEYHAFLAGALQRQQRHRDAAEQYQAALQSAPQNGVWWMGLGISLQAEKRDGEALDAFRKARAAGSLTGELLAFVEQKIQQLTR
jgi:MSHA biogenesis protein MshN